MLSAAQPIRFSHQDLDLFSQASGDRNPLHLSASYAAKTAYGQPVVFGALGAVASLGYLAPSDDRRLAKLTVDFHRPMFLDVEYTARLSRAGDADTVRLFDGSVPVLTLSATWDPRDARAPARMESPAHFERTEAKELVWDELPVGYQTSGLYAADSWKLQELLGRWRVSLDPGIAELLLWSSYMVGMELPGLNALFFRVALNFGKEPPPADQFEYKVSVANANKSASQLRLKAELTAGGTPLASGQLVAFVRPDIPPPSFDELIGEDSSGQALKDKVAVVIGASRGLGAAITVALAAQGAHVVALSRSTLGFLGSLPLNIAERISVESADASDSGSLAQLSNKLRDRFGSLHFLVCSAFPPIPALRLEPNAQGRVRTYMTRSTELVLGPLCAFLPLLNEIGGCSVIISSVAVEKPVRDWPHYVAAKNAIEGLGEVACLQYPQTSTLIVRPDRLLTDMTNTPMGRQNALPPSMLARQIVEELQTPPLPGTSRVFHGTSVELMAEPSSTVK